MSGKKRKRPDVKEKFNYSFARRILIKEIVVVLGDDPQNFVICCIEREEKKIQVRKDKFKMCLGFSRYIQAKEKVFMEELRRRT